MEFQDRVLKCLDCGTEFVWTAGEQAFYADKQFKNEPKRCRACKARRGPRQTTPSQSQSHERVETRASCSSCGKETTVPFKPTQGRPVYCRECFQHRKPHGRGAS